MPNNRAAITALHQRGYRNCEISRMLCVARETVSRVIKRFKELGHDGERPGKGRKRSVNTSRNRQLIKKRVQRNPRISMRKIARDTGINREAVRRMAKNELMLKPYKLQKRQLLTEKNKQVRLQRCRQLLQRAAGKNWENFLFTDEKLFTVEQAHNRQNDRIWSANAPGPSSVVEHRQKSKSVMVWAGVCASGKTPLVFVEQGVKINKDVYVRDILQAVVLPWAQQHFGDQKWTLQQDSAPAHRAKTTQEWCKTNFPSFISAAEWPPYSPDLNPMDYSIWSVLEARVCAKPHNSLESLKQTLRKEWDRMSEEELRRVAENFPRRLKLCIKAKGGHFEIH